MSNTVGKMLNFNTFLGISFIYLVTPVLFALFLMLFVVGCGFRVRSNVAMRLIHISLFGKPSSTSDNILVRFFFYFLFFLLFVESGNKVPDARNL
jgi:hypothetical protein